MTRSRIRHIAETITVLLLFPAVAVATMAAYGAHIRTATIPMTAARQAGGQPNPDQFIATVVRDKRDGNLLAVRLGTINTGQFSFVVNKVGTFTGTLPVKKYGTRSSASADLPATFQPTNGGGSSQVTVRISFIIDTRAPAPTAHAKIKEVQPTKTREYQIHTDNTSAERAEKVFDRVSDAIEEQDWPTLYRLESSEITSAISQDDFVAKLRAQHPGTVTAVMATGAATETDAQGFRYVAEPVTVTLKKTDGSTVSQASHLTLVLEDGRWLLMGTDQGTLS